MVIGQLLGVEKVVAHLDQERGEVQAVLRTEVRRLAVMLSGYVKTSKLTGQVLRVRTGRLRRSITLKVLDEGTLVSGIVGTNVEYGRAWELGFDRRVGAGARGGPRTLMSDRALARYRALHPPGLKHYSERSFLRSALNDLAPEIRASLELAMRRALR